MLVGLHPQMIVGCVLGVNTSTDDTPSDTMLAMSRSDEGAVVQRGEE